VSISEAGLASNVDIFTQYPHASKYILHILQMTLKCEPSIMSFQLNCTMIFCYLKAYELSISAVPVCKCW
jgi:hypothetical protein